MTVSASTFRIYTEDGLYRLTVLPEDSLSTLYDKIGEKCKLGDPKNFQVFLDANRSDIVEAVPHRSVGSLPGHVQSLYTQRLKSLNSHHPAMHNNFEKDAESPHVLSKPTAAPEDKSSSNSHFVSLDYFLSCREYNTLDLPLSKSFKAQPLKKGSATTIPASTTLKYQPYRSVDHIEFRNIEEMNHFVNYWAYERHMEEQRAGFLYGFYVEDTHYPMGIRAVVEAIYEPSQMDQDGKIVLFPDPDREAVDRLAQTLQLECVGYIFTHLPRQDLLSSEDVIHTARLQLQAMEKAPKHYTGYPVAPFISVTISADTENNSFRTNAFIISDLGMALVRDDVLMTAEHTTQLIVKPLPSNLIRPQILEGGKPVEFIDPHWFIVRVNDSAPKKVESLFKSWSFPSENRNRPDDPLALINHLSKDVKDPLEIYADFHFILNVCTIFNEETAQLVCQSIITKQPLDSSVVEMFRVVQSSAY